MGFGTALIYSLLGISVVFLALILLMLMIQLSTAVTDRMAKEPPASAAVSAAPEPAAVSQAPAPGSAGELKLYDTDPRTAAMLMAIVADELQTPLSELRFISIRESKE